jgi:hypothetical protein
VKLEGINVARKKSKNNKKPSSRYEFSKSITIFMYCYIYILYMMLNHKLRVKEKLVNTINKSKFNIRKYE